MKLRCNVWASFSLDDGATWITDPEGMVMKKKLVAMDLSRGFW
jgi:hypothetical protein